MHLLFHEGAYLRELTQEPYIRHMDPKLSCLLGNKKGKKKDSSLLTSAVHCFNIFIPSKFSKQIKSSLHSLKLSDIEGMLIALETNDRLLSCTLR